ARRKPRARRARATSRATTRRTTTTNEDRHRFPGIREQVRHREGDALHALGARRRAGHHQLVLRREPAYGGAQALAAAWRQGCLSQSRRLAHLERLLRL